MWQVRGKCAHRPQGSATRCRKTSIGVPGDFHERAAVAVVAGVVGKAVVIVIAGTGDKALQQL